MSDQEQTIEQRSNDHVTVLFKTKPGCIIKMEVHVSRLAVKAAHDKALKEVRKEISLPGFRKGKVPEEIVTKQFSPQVERHTKEVLTDTSFREALSLVKRHPFTTRSVRKSEIKQQTKDGTAILLFEYEASPDVPSVDTSILSLQSKEIQQPTEESIATSLMKLKILHADKHLIDSRAVRENDLITVSVFETGENEESSLIKLVDNEQFYVRQGYLPEWLIETTLGMTPGQTKKVASVPERMQDFAASGKDCQVVVHTIHECILPQEDDIFAQKTGAESMADVKNKLLERAHQDAKEHVQSDLRLNLKNELIRHYAFDLPQSLIEGETEARYKSYVDMSEKQGTAASFDKETVRKEFQEEVKRYFTCLFLMERVAKEAKPTYNQSEFFDELTYQMIKAPFQERSIYPGLSQDEVQQRVLMNIMMKKCFDWCIEQKLLGQQIAAAV